MPGRSPAESWSRRNGMGGVPSRDDTATLRLLKITAQVRIGVPKIWIRYSKAHPWKNAFVSVWAACAAEGNLPR